MKTINFKSALPILVMAIAITSAFAFQNDERAKTTSVQGWIDHPNPCSIPETCEDEGGAICTIMYGGTLYDVKGKFNPNDLTCERVLTRKQ